jgi:hypothetical protein
MDFRCQAIRVGIRKSLDPFSELLLEARIALERMFLSLIGQVAMLKLRFDPPHSGGKALFAIVAGGVAAFGALASLYRPIYDL